MMRVIWSAAEMLRSVRTNNSSTDETLISKRTVRDVNTTGTFGHEIARTSRRMKLEISRGP